MQADIHIGKQGYRQVVPEIKARLEKKGEVRIKVNRPLIAGRMKAFTKEVAQQVAGEVGAEISMVRGRTFVLKRCDK